MLYGNIESSWGTATTSDATSRSVKLNVRRGSRIHPPPQQGLWCALSGGIVFEAEIEIGEESDRGVRGLVKYHSDVSADA